MFPTLDRTNNLIEFLGCVVCKNTLNMKVSVFLCLILLTNCCFTARIALLPLYAPSHYLVMEKLGAELHRRGHEVMVFVYEGAPYIKPTTQHIKSFKIENAEAIADHMSGKSFTKVIKLPTSMILQLFGLQKTYCDNFLSDKNVLEVIKTADVVLGDSLYPCSALVAAKFRIPHVVIVETSLGIPILELYHISTYPSYTPQLWSKISPDGMDLLGRTKNFVAYLMRFFFVEVCYYYYGGLVDKHNINPQESIRKTLGTVDLILLEKDLVVDYAIPLPPYVKEVGSFLPGPGKPLNPEWEDFISSSGDDGVILVTFGSMEDTFNNKIVATMNEAFSRVPQKVIWRINTENFNGKIAPNVKTSRWVPQNDILAHPKVKLFYTHAGAGGVAEAVYHGVPLICSPLSRDQFDNAANVEYIGLGEILSVKTATADQLVNMMNKILHDKRYKEKAIYLSKVVRKRPRSPLEEASEQIEYLHAVGNLSHLKPLSMDMPFYQRYMLDVLLVIAVVLSLVLYIIVAILKGVYRLCCGSSQKVKTS